MTAVRIALAVSTVMLSLAGTATRADAALIATKKTSQPFAGVTLIEGTTGSPKTTFQAAVVSLCTAGVHMDATPVGPRRTVPSWGASAGAKVAVNGDFFKDDYVYGLAVGGGKAWPVARTGVAPALKDEWFYEHYGWIAVGKDWVEFSHSGAVKEKAAALGVKEGFSPTKISHDVPPGTLALVSGFPELITEGKRYTCTSPTADSCFPDRSDMRDRNPRTAMGLSRDRRTLILAVVDGRSATSVGMYGSELAVLMEELGAWQAFNLDGGGSSEMWVAGRGTISTPSDPTARAVANHWGVFVDKNPAAHCQPLAATKPDGGVEDGGASPAPGPSDGESTNETPDAGADAPSGNGADAAESDGCAVSPGARGSYASGAALFGLALALFTRLRRRRSSNRRER
jgi:hypothetical protein